MNRRAKKPSKFIPMQDSDSEELFHSITEPSSARKGMTASSRDPLLPSNDDYDNDDISNGNNNNKSKSDYNNNNNNNSSSSSSIYNRNNNLAMDGDLIKKFSRIRSNATGSSAAADSADDDNNNNNDDDDDNNNNNNNNNNNSNNNSSNSSRRRRVLNREGDTGGSGGASRGSSPVLSSSTTSWFSRGPSTPGVCGLNNLGNTCYLNAAVQCLNACTPLTEYILSGDYKKDINEKNPCGYGGKVATAYATLLRKIWTADKAHSSVAPRDFKTVVGDANDMFSGYGQKDSQELLGFLMDALHEDMNTVRNKPLTEPVDDSLYDNVQLVAQESWARHLLRNRSKIVEFFQGMFKSTVSCLKCNKL